MTIRYSLRGMFILILLTAIMLAAGGKLWSLAKQAERMRLVNNVVDDAFSFYALDKDPYCSLADAKELRNNIIQADWITAHDRDQLVQRVDTVIKRLSIECENEAADTDIRYPYDSVPLRMINN